MKSWLYRILTQLKWQLVVTVFSLAGFLTIYYSTSIWYSSFDDMGKGNFISYMTGLASILALFCSVSFGFVIHYIQSNRAERLSVFSEFKSRLFDFDSFVSAQSNGHDKDVCKSLIFELNKYDISDLPQTDYGKEYRIYAKTLEVALESSSKNRREFYLYTSMHMGYIEQLLNRLGLVAISQILTKLFVNTLAKGIFLVSLMILFLFMASIFYSDDLIPTFFSGALFFSIMTVFVFTELVVDLYRNVDEELDFVDRIQT